MYLFFFRSAFILRKTNLIRNDPESIQSTSLESKLLESGTTYPMPWEKTGKDHHRSKEIGLSKNMHAQIIRMLS